MTQAASILIQEDSGRFIPVFRGCDVYEEINYDPLKWYYFRDDDQPGDVMVFYTHDKALRFAESMLADAQGILREALKYYMCAEVQENNI